MGADIEIYCRSAGDPPECNIDGEWEAVRDDDDDTPKGATHRLSSITRYYGPGYERGPWPVICGDLLRTMSDPDVETVWYGNDYGAMDEITFEIWSEFSAHYLNHRHEPSRSAFQQA